MKSPSRQAAPVIAVTYKCDDCGDVSHSQASLSLHRSVCHSAGKSHEITDIEFAEESVEDIGKTEQIADACNCPKCGEHFLLLRQNNFTCSLCDFQDLDQGRFFVHLKEHYEPDSILTVDPGSVIIEQVIDDTNDLGNRNDAEPDDQDEPDDRYEPDDRDDPEYLPDNDNDNDNDDDDDDGGDKDWEEPKTKKQKVAEAKSPPKDTITQKTLVVSPNVNKSKDVKPLKGKMGILWQQEKGAPKKLSFVKTQPTKTDDAGYPVSQTSLKENSAQKRPSFTSVTIKQEPVSGDEAAVDSGKTTKWVRLQDIKYVKPGTSPGKSPWNASSYSGPSPLSDAASSKYAALRTAPRSYNRKSSAAKSGGATDDKDSGKAKQKQPKAPKRPRERKIPVCGICKRVFSTSQGLKMHLFIHTGEKNYSCEHCGKSFTQWSTCQQHIESIHCETKKYTCEFCGTSFARSSGLKVHRRIHTGEVLHHCNVCGKGFRAKSYLDRHRTLHTGEKRYRCEFCSKLFRTSTDMKRHRNSVHFGLGNVSLTQAREILQSKVDGYIRTPRTPRTQQRPSRTVIQRFVEEDSSPSDENDEVVRATTVIAGSHYEL